MYLTIACEILAITLLLGGVTGLVALAFAD